MPTLSDVVQFAASGPTLVTRWLPAVDYYSETTPVFAVQAAGDVLAWYPAFASSATGDRVRQVVQTDPNTFRVDFASSYDQSAVFRRPRTADEKQRGFEWLAQVQNEYGIDMAARVKQALTVLQGKAPQPARDKLFPVSYWSEYDFRISKTVPAGIVVPSDDNRSIQWIGLPGWEEMANDQNRTRSVTIEDPMSVLTELAERPGQNRSVSYPEYVRAADSLDAAEIALRKQWETLTSLVGVPVEEQNQ